MPPGKPRSGPLRSGQPGSSGRRSRRRLSTRGTCRHPTVRRGCGWGGCARPARRSSRTSSCWATTTATTWTSPATSPTGPSSGRHAARLDLRAAQALHDERRAVIRHLIAVGMDDEQIAAQVGFWPASMIAGYRKDDAKAARLAARAARGEIVKVPHGSDCPCAFCDGPCGCPSCESFRRTGRCAEPEEAEGMLF